MHNVDNFSIMYYSINTSYKSITSYWCQLKNPTPGMPLQLVAQILNNKPLLYRVKRGNKRTASRPNYVDMSNVLWLVDMQ